MLPFVEGMVDDVVQVADAIEKKGRIRVARFTVATGMHEVIVQPAHSFSAIPSAFAAAFNFLSLVQRGTRFSKAEDRRWTSIHPIPFP